MGASRRFRIRGESVIPGVYALESRPRFLADSRARRILTPLTLLGLYVFGLVHWAWYYCPVSQVLRTGTIPHLTLSIYDWSKDMTTFRIIRDAIGEGRIPYHVEDPGGICYNLKNGRFLGLPETILSPDILLLALLGRERFVLAHVLILYSPGFPGSLALRRRYRLDAISFAIFFMLFSFNGHIASHLTAGHTM